MPNLRLERIGQGLCRDCGEPRTAEGTRERCPDHAAEHSRKQAERNAANREEWRDKGLCMECGAVRAPGSTLCAVHRIKAANRSREYQQRLSA